MFYPNGIATISQRTLAGITNIERYFWWQGIHGCDCFHFHNLASLILFRWKAYNPEATMIKTPKIVLGVGISLNIT